MKSVNREFNEKFFKHIFAFEELLRDMKFNKIRMLNRRAAGIKEDIKVTDLIRPSIVCGHSRDIEEDVRINEKILLDYYYRAGTYRSHLYNITQIVVYFHSDCNFTKRFLGRIGYYIHIMKEISKIIDIADGS